MDENCDMQSIRQSYECMNACILNHMSKRNFNISGSDIFFIGKGNFIYYKKGSFTRISSEGYEANFRFLQWAGIDYRFGRMAPSKQSLLRMLDEP